MADARGENGGDAPVETEVLAGSEPARLDVALARGLEVSRGRARRLLAEGRVSLEGRELRLSDKSLQVEPGQRLRIAAAGPAESLHPEPETSLVILAEGEGWVAVDKPAGRPVHPLREDEKGTVLGALAARYPEIDGVGESGLRSGVVHRLDVETSGVLLFATRPAAWDRLRAAFRRHRVAKRYRAIVLGRLEGPLELEPQLIVARHRPAFVRVVEPDASGAFPRASRPTQMQVEPLELFREATLVEVFPKTGFLHQIRATLAHLGHPVAGDARYGRADLRDPTGAGRTLLHAAAARFEEIAATSPDPADFAAALEALRS